MSPSIRHPRTPPRPFPIRRAGAIAAVLAGLAIVACAAGGPSSGDDRASRKADEPAYRTATLAGTAGRQLDYAKVTNEAFEKDGKIDDGSRATLDPNWTNDRRKVIRSGQIELIVPGYDAARGRIEAIVAAAGGYVDSTRVSHNEGQVSDAVIVIRVPSTAFADLMPRLRELGDVRHESTDSADITDEYVDVAARLEAARALEKRLLELSQSRTGTVAEVLEVERELARVRGEIEQYEGRIRLWDDQVSMSSLTLVLSTRTPEIAAAGAPGFGERASHALDQSLATLRDAGQGLAVGALALVPWLPLIIPALFLGWRLVRRRTWLPRAFARPAAAYPAAAYPAAPGRGMAPGMTAELGGHAAAAAEPSGAPSGTGTSEQRG